MAAIVGKLIGTALPVAGCGGVLRLGARMVPQAEIAMVIMHQGKAMGPDVVSEALYAGVLLTVAVTFVLAPMILRPLLRGHSADGGGE